MRILDTHLHLIYQDSFTYPWLGGAPKLNRQWTAESYFAEAAALGVEQAIHMEVDVAEDQIFAETEGLFGKRLVAGAFVFSAGLGLVATNCINAFSYGYDRLRFIKPTFIGDTIYTIRTNLSKEPKYKDLGLIRASYEVFKGEGELVLYCEHIQTVRYRDPASFVPKGS